MKRITDQEFRYTPSFATDLRKTFRKVEQGLKRQNAPAPEQPQASHASSVVTLATRARSA